MYTVYNHKDKEKHMCSTVEDVNKYLDKLDHTQYSISTQHEHGEQYEMFGEDRTFPYTIKLNDEERYKLKQAPLVRL